MKNITRSMCIHALLVIAIAFSSLMMISNKVDAVGPTFVQISEAHFPDPVFREYVTQFDKNGDRILEPNEREAVKGIYVWKENVSDLYGIQYFPNIEYLSCGNNSLTKLDLYNNTALKYLDCSDNQLTSLDLSYNPALTELNGYRNALTELNISNCTNLKSIDLRSNHLSSLDVSKNADLSYLDCGGNELTKLDVSKNTALKTLMCFSNKLTKLDVSKNTSLKRLVCSDNQLYSLDVSKNTALVSLSCGKLYLKTLDVSKNTALESIYCQHNQLTTLDVSKNTALKLLDCTYNYMDSKPQVSRDVDLRYDPQNFSVIKQPEDYFGQVGSTAVFKLTTSQDNIHFQWQTYINGEWKNSTFAGATTDTLSVPVTQEYDGYKFRCIASRLLGEYTSDVVTLHVIKPFSIITQPKNYAGPAGSKATFSVIAQGTGLSYQWQYYSGGKWTNFGRNKSNVSLTVSNSHNGMKYRCVVKDSSGKTVTSNVANISITKTLSIITQPKNYSGPAGSKATFSITAQGTGLSYQWQYYSGGTWKNFGSNKPTVSLTVSNTHNGMKYRCVVKDSAGKSVTSNTATIKVVTTQTLSIITQPKNYTGSVGSRATFSVTAQGTGLSYQWQYYSGGVWKNFGSNKSTVSLTVSNSHNGMTYRCIVKDSSGKTVTSNTATINIK